MIREGRSPLKSHSNQQLAIVSTGLEALARLLISLPGRQPFLPSSDDQPRETDMRSNEGSVDRGLRVGGGLLLTGLIVAW